MKKCTVCNKILYKTNISGLCHAHGQKKGKDHYRKKGMFIGENAGNWQGGRRINAQGYIEILSPGHPNAQKYTNYVVEHRLIVEKYIGRYLKKSEDVHHINNNRTDNSIYNLMLFNGRSSHRRYECGSNVNKEEILFDGSKL